MDFANPGWSQSKIERKWKEKIGTPTLPGDFIKLCNMKEAVIPITIGILGTVTKGLVHEPEDLEIRGQMETIQTTASLRSARILRRFL